MEPLSQDVLFLPRDTVQDERELTPEHDPGYVQRFEVWERPKKILLIQDMITGALFQILDLKSMTIYMGEPSDRFDSQYSWLM